MTRHQPPGQVGGAAAPATEAAVADAEPVRVMVVDDSAVIRSALARLLESAPAGSAPDIVVVARAADGAQAIEALRRRQADAPVQVVLLDIEMPVLDGLATLPLLLRASPGLRVIMVSALTTRGAEVTLQALTLGAADYIAKPGAAEVADDGFRRELLAKVRSLGRRRVAPPARAVPAAPAAMAGGSPLLLAIGSSTGGPQALLTLVQTLGRDLPLPVVVAQHMPAAFTPLLAAHLDRLGGMGCAEARHGEMLRRGRIYLAPGGQHLLVAAQGDGLRAVLSDAPPENFCRPSVDVLLRSAAQACRGRVLVAMLTGMGQDGLEGTRAVVAAGGVAVAQDEASSVVWGMPGAIAQAGLCRAVLPLTRMAASLLALAGGTGRPA